MDSEETKYKEDFEKNIKPSFTEYFDQSRMEKRISSYKFLMNELKKLETACPETVYKHVMSKKVLLKSKNAKNISRDGIQIKYMRQIILKMFNVSFTKEDVENKRKDVFKGRDCSELEEQCPTFTTKSFDEILPVHFLNEKGIKALKEILWLLNGILPKLEYCPMLLTVASLLLIFLSKEETYELLRNIIEIDQKVEESNSLRWHFKYTLMDNMKLYVSIASCIYEISNDHVTKNIQAVENLGLPKYKLMQDMAETFFIDYVNFVAIIKFLPFFLREGVKGIYRLMYGIISLCDIIDKSVIQPKTDPLIMENLDNIRRKVGGTVYISAKRKMAPPPSFNEENKDKLFKEDTNFPKKSEEEVIKMFKETSNKITNFSTLMEIATNWGLTHTNNNFQSQWLPPDWINNTPRVKNLKYIPSLEPDSKIISRKDVPLLWGMIPSDIKLHDGILLYSKDTNPECDLSVIYEMEERFEDEDIMFFVIETENGEIFGGVMKQAIKLYDSVRFITLSEAYLFTVKPEMKVYTAKDPGHDEIVCFEPGAFRYGNGTDGPAITLSFDLNYGRTEKNTVFGNDVKLIQDYSEDGMFKVKNLEIYLLQ